MKRIFISLTFSFLAICFYCAPTSAGIHQDLVKEYIRLSGMEEIISTFPEQLDLMNSQRLLTSKTPEEDKKLNEMMKEAFDIEIAMRDLNTFLLENTDIAFLRDLLQWLDSPLGKKIKNEELKSSGAEHQADMLRFMADMQTTPPEQERIALIQDLEETLHLSDLTTIIVIEMIQGMTQAVNFSLPEEERQSEEEILEEVASLAPMLKESFRQQMIMTSFYTYRNISDSDLRDYIRFYKSPTGQKEIDITGKALSSVLKQWFFNIGQSLLKPRQEEKQMT
jgi:hypothetical protein